MTTDVHRETNYFAVFGSLAVLTAIEVGIYYLHMPRFVFVTALLLLALLKAFLVAWYFMHLRSEKWTLAILTIIPFVLGLDLLIGLLPDISHILH
jgi:cytochrome c oxidase subunit 4